MTESVIVFDVATLVGLAMVAVAVQGAGRRIAKARERSVTRVQNTIREVHQRGTRSGSVEYTPDEDGGGE